jgi:hypothetical protein
MNYHIPPIHTELTVTPRPVLEWAHADTCLPDYWRGHHLPHIAVLVWHGMTFVALKEAIRNELRQGYVSGSCDAARVLQADYVAPEEEAVADALTRAAYAAVNRIKPARKGQRKLFMDLDPIDDDEGPDVCAYFVLRDLERK